MYHRMSTSKVVGRTKPPVHFSKPPNAEQQAIALSGTTRATKCLMTLCAAKASAIPKFLAEAD